MGNKGFSARFVLPFVFALMVVTAACEKEEFGNLVTETGEMIASLSWSESSDQILYSTYDDVDYYKKTIWLADIGTGDVNMITSLQTETEPYRIINQKDGRLYYFSFANLDYWNVKLYAIDFTGSNRELILDSIQNPVFSQKYAAYLKWYYLPDTSYSEIQLYDLDNKTIKKADIGRDGLPVSISPDGQTLLIMSYDIQYNNTIYILYDTGSDTATELSVSSFLYLYDFFWIDNVVYGRSGYGEDFRIINLATGRELEFSEPLTSSQYYTLSPSGSMIAWMVDERPALAVGLVDSHLFLHILNTGSSEKTIIDLDRGESSMAVLAFSPDETRIAYVRNGTEIYIIDL